MPDPIPLLQAPPRDEAELLARARRLAGRTVAEVARDVGSRPPDDLKRHKGYIGELCEACLGAPRSSRPEPDFAHLGVELKTLPLSRSGSPLESTYVCRVDPGDLAGTTWERSRFRKKIARILWVPYEGDPRLAPAQRTWGTAFLWSPDDDEDAVLREDWEDFADLAAQGLLTAVSARRGRFLQLRPKAAHARVRQVVAGRAGEQHIEPPRGFYLRQAFTSMLLEKAFRPRP